MKKLALFVFACLAATADAPDTAVVVSTESVLRTVTREPSTVVLSFSDSGEVSAEVSYYRVVRVGGETISKTPFKTVVLSWQQITNLVPALSASLEQFKSAAKASMTNTP